MKRMKVTLEDLFNLPGAEIFNPDSYRFASSVSTDTRTIRKNSLFFAIKGDKFDGHNFVKDAANKGASAVIINKNRLKDFDEINCTIVTVKDTIISYGDLAKIWRSRLNSKVIAITGSNGKTTTKEMLSVLFGKHYNVCKTLANNNNHIGVPLTIFSADNSHDYLILELGTNHFGEIAYTAEIASPDYAVVTNIGDSHLEFLTDRKGVAEEKIALLDITAAKNGTVFINADDPFLKKKFNSYKKRITFGFNKDADIRGEVLNSENSKPIVKIKKSKTIIKTELPVYGTSNVKNFLIAAAIAIEAGLTKEEIIEAVPDIKPVDKRLNIKNIGNFTLINDTYNANPESMKSALEFINHFSGNRKKTAVFGDMFELGKKGRKAHIDLLKYIKKNKIDEVYTIGNLMKYLADELKDTRIINKHFSGREKLAEFLTSADFSNSVVLVKGSRGMKMEEFVKILEAKKK